MNKVCGKILSIPRKMKNRKSKPVGKILATRGELSGLTITFNAPFELISFLKLRMLVCLHGEWDEEKNHFYVADVEDITRDLTNQDVEALSMLAPGLMSSNIEQALKVLELSRISELVNLLTGISRDENINQLADEMGEEEAFSLVKTVDEVSKDRDRLNVCKLFESCTSLDFQHAVLAVDQLHKRAAMNEISVAQLIEEYPWVLAQVFDDDGLRAADIIAKLKGKDFPLERCQARIMAHLVKDVRQGHSYTPFSYLWGDLSKDFTQDVIREALAAKDASWNKKNKLKGYYVPEPVKHAEQIKDDLIKKGVPEDKAEKESKAVILPSVFWSEVHGAENLVKTLNTEGIHLDPAAIRKKMQAYADVKLDKEQLSIANAICQNKVTVITGQAGSGKTTVIKSLIYALQETSGENIPVLAPTGTAAQRAGAEVGANFSTIHRWSGIALGDDDYAMGTSEKEENANQEKSSVLIVDEMSMATITIFHRLMHVTDSATRVVFVGDPAQLPSIGPGGVFEALISLAGSGIEQMTHVKLKDNYRTKDGVTVNALKVRNGEPIDTSYKGIEMVDANTEKSIINKVIEIANQIKSASWDDILILGSTRTKGVGTDKLNQALKKEYGNPSIDDDIEFSIGDPVITIRNDYVDQSIPQGFSPARQKAWKEILSLREKDRPTIYNGTRGIISDFINEDEMVEVTYHTPEGEIKARYHVGEVKYYIELAYATTIHKIQGGQAKYVIYAGNTSLDREKLYTVLTRSTENIWLVGPDELWNNAVEKTANSTRSKFKYRVLAKIEDMLRPEKEVVASLDEIDIDNQIAAATE